MALINPKAKEVQIKIVYYGPGRCGKTTNLDYIYRHLKGDKKSEMVSLKTKDDRTLFFDYLPVDAGSIFGHRIKINLYTVPGQVKYNATRKLVLRGADGIVFVADSMKIIREKNLVSLRNLQKNLQNYNRSIFKIPLVLQYNKRDLADQGIPLLSFARIQKDLNSQLKVPAFEACALGGHNVIKTAQKIISLAVGTVKKQLKVR
jgi:mutual gliding-motility protein MglA